MEKSFTANGSIASTALITALLKDRGPWAHAILGQCYSMPPSIREALLEGKAEWQIPNAKTITIILAESQ